VDNRRLLIAFMLSLAVLIAWNLLFPPPKPPRPEPPRAEAPARTGEAAAPENGPAGVEPSFVPGGPPETAEAPTPEEAPRERVEAEIEQRVTLETDRLRAVFTNRGAQLVSLILKEQAASDGGPLDLVRRRPEGAYPYGLVGPDLEPLPLNQVLFRVEPGELGGEGRSVTFRYAGPEGEAVKSFRFDERGLLASEIAVEGAGRWGLAFGPGLRNPSAEELASRFDLRGAVYKEPDEEPEVLETGGAEGTVQVAGGRLRWVGLEDTYFLTALIPAGEGRVERAVFQPVYVEPGEEGVQRFVPLPPEEEISKAQSKLPREYRLVLQPAGGSLDLLAYWGSKEYDRLAEMPYGLEETVRFGMFWFIARPLLAGLHWIHDHVVANYGWAIILMTVLIKILLLPLTHKSTVSMRKMQELQPKMQAIRERYRAKLKDKQGRPNLEMQRKMNEEVMGLYKTEGVNPAGGCLPILLQMPILFAFYRLLTAAAELRGAPWILWIGDLAVRDPYYVLPIVMGVTQFLQVRLAPQAGDPMQRRIFQLMPVMMTFLFLGFPAGLVLYWLTNNVLTIVQQAVYNRLHKKTA
jgi:YidC/Oxa1 family membrane protein insertase